MAILGAGASPLDLPAHLIDEDDPGALQGSLDSKEYLNCHAQFTRILNSSDSSQTNA